MLGGSAPDPLVGEAFAEPVREIRCELAGVESPKSPKSLGNERLDKKIRLAVVGAADKLSPS